MKKALVASTLLVSLLALVDRVNPVREGLNGTYYPNTTWSDPPAVSTRDSQLTNDTITDAWGGAPPPGFSATWAGSFLAMHDGPYVLATISDDGSSVYVDGQAVVDNAGARTWPRGATGTITLTRGVHAIHVRYVREDGPFHFDLLWARAGEPLERMPGWALTPRRVSFWAFRVSAAARQALAASQVLWVGSIVIAAVAFVWSHMLKVRAWLERDEVWRTLRWILAASFILNVAGIWWGLPGGSWAPDELVPLVVLDAAAQRFAHGWFDRYPPFHFYVLTAVFSPLLVLQWLGRVDLSATAPSTLLALAGRLISVAAGAGTLVAVYACGARTFGKRAGIFAAATLSLVVPFVYYAKTANLDVPYLFWFAVSLLFYLRLLETLAFPDFIGFAVCATLAICTKDQAYGLYLLAPVAILHRMWRANRDAGVSAPFVRALLDGKLRWAAFAALVLFAACHNVPFNAGGFADHVRLVTGPAAASYREFEPTVLGRLALLRLSIEIVRAAWGWPMFLVAAVGVVLALLTPAYRLMTVWLALPVVSYYFGFVNVVLYNYDRFMLPVCLVLSLFAGLAFDRWLSRGPGRSWRAAGAALVFACTMLYAATVDLGMLEDSRYTVERWLAARVRPTDTVAFVFPVQYYPRLERFNGHEVTSVDQLQHERPSYYVLNADYGLAEPPDSPIGRLIAGLQNGDLGYDLVFRFRAPAPWPWLPGAPLALVGPRNERPITSALRHINPRYEVFKKTG